jgi:hypothetical protein
MDFLLWMLRSPEAQVDAYGWGAVLLAHFAIGLVLTILLIWPLGARRAAWATIVVYCALWEGAQLAFYGASLSDSAVDALAVACGAFVASGLWLRRFAPLAAALALLAAIGIAGVRNRK